MAKIREQDIDSLRERVDIVEIISGYSRLKRAGGHTHKGLCPFHSEKTPSFTVDSAKGLWHCFGCGQGGNVYQFIQKVENLPFPEAVEWLARKTGTVLQYEESRPGDARAAGLRARLIAANEAAAEFFHSTLIGSPAALQARRYLEGRGFGLEVAKRWQLGFAPGRDSLCRHLLERRFSSAEVEQADLGRRSERDGSLYDTFRARIIFPTWSLQGDVIGFGARALGDQQPKYLNSAETQVFSKSRVLFGLNRAKSAIARGSAIVVEGYTDVIALHESGLTEAVATNGVALGESHLELLKKFTQRVILMLDADEAGRGATERTFDIQHRIGVEVLVAPLPSGSDPADVAREGGLEQLKKVLENARPLLEFKLMQTIEKLDLDTPEARARAVREAAKVLGWHPDPIARHEYAFMVAKRIGVDPEGIQRALTEDATRVPAPSGGGGSGGGQDRRLPGHVKVEREALRLLLSGSKEAAAWSAGVDEGDFTSPARRELFAAARAALGSDAGPSVAVLAERLSPDGASLLTGLSVGSSDDPIQAAEVFARLKVFSLERSIRSRRNVLEKVNPVDEPGRHDELFTELVGLEAKRRDLLRQLQGAA